MSVPEEIRKLTEGVVASFGSDIGTVGHLIRKGLEILDGYQREEEAVRSGLRENLASVSSLRHKDFDGLVEKILDFQSQREVEIKTLIRTFLASQGELSETLRHCLEGGLLQEAERLKEELAGKIEGARRELLSFQREQGLIRQTFASLEEKNGQVSGREFKKAIQDLETALFGADVAQQQAMGNG